LVRKFFSPSKAVAIKDLKRGYCRSWCQVARGNLSEAGWQVNYINFVAAKFMLGLFVPSSMPKNSSGQSFSATRKDLT
jgi:hypothetical protein